MDFENVANAIRKRAEDVVSRIRRCGGVEISVGIDPDATYPNGKSVAEVASFVSNGTRRMPPRPFLRNAMREARPVIGAKMRSAVEKAVRTGEDADGMLLEIADDLKDRIQDEILKEGIYDTGRLFDSVVVRVEGGAEA